MDPPRTPDPLSGLDEAYVYRMCSDQSLARARAYARAGAVNDLAIEGDGLVGRVHGSRATPYEVQVQRAAEPRFAATCTCPYDWGGWCKHIAATVLVYLGTDEDVARRPPLAERLTAAGASEMAELVLELVDHDPDLRAHVDAFLARREATHGAGDGGGIARTGLGQDLAALYTRRTAMLIHNLDRMRRSDAYWHVADVVSDFVGLLDEAHQLAMGDDPVQGLAALEGATAAWVAEWTHLDSSDGSWVEAFEALERVWPQVVLACLVEGPDAVDADALRATIGSWKDALEPWDLGHAFDTTLAALDDAWQGSVLGPGARPDGDEDRWVADDLLRAGLAVLDRRGRTEAALELATRWELVGECARLLAVLGRVEEAKELGREGVVSYTETVALARTLWGGGQRASALDVALERLDDGDIHPDRRAERVHLARWLVDRARDEGRDDVALTAARAAFRDAPDLAGYRDIEALAGDAWPELRDDLIEHVRTTELGSRHDRAHLLVHAGHVRAAIDVVGDDGDPTLVAVVAAAAVELEPSWVARAAKRQAASIIKPGRADLYDAAVEWLELARDAHEAACDDGAWEAYLKGLVAGHWRKYKLMRLMQPLLQDAGVEAAKPR